MRISSLTRATMAATITRLIAAGCMLLPAPGGNTEPVVIPVTSATPVAPVTPVTPAIPVTPVKPAEPVASVAPVTPVTPVAPAISVAPVKPATPLTPVAPAIPVTPVKPAEPVASVAPATPIAPVTPVMPVAPAIPVAPVKPATPATPVTPLAGNAIPATVPVRPSAKSQTKKPVLPNQETELSPLPSTEQKMAAGEARRIISQVTLQRDESDEAAPLLSQDVLKKFTPALRRQIQQALLEIYDDDPAYMLAYRESTMPLSDNIVGPVTLSWLNRFWFDFEMEPSGNLTNASVAVLLHFAATLKAHLEWKGDLVSADLKQWIDSFDNDDKARYYQIRLAGTDEQIIAMLWLYHYATDHSRQPAPDPDRALLTIYHYSLTENDFKLLAAKSQVITKLSALQDEVYLNEPLFDVAVLGALKDLGPQAGSYLPAARAAALEQSYQLTPESLQLLRDSKTVPDLVINKLETLTETYPGEALFTDAILEATNTLNEPIIQYLSEIVSAAEASTSYILTARALKELSVNRKNEPVPQVMLDMLNGLQDLDYPQMWLFDKAVIARLRQSIGACSGGKMDNVSEHRKVSAEQMKQLEAVLNDDNLSGQLDKLWQNKACSPADRLAMPQQIEALYMKYRASIRDTARKKPAYDPDKHVLWDGGGCGCVLEQLAGEVYGFYPFWLAGSPQKVNFSTLTRIGYYGPTFDDSGVLRQANDGRDLVTAAENGDLMQNNFINIAQRHQTAVDWVIQRNDWRSWSKMDKDRKEMVLQRLTTSIVRLMSVRLNSWNAALWNHLPFGDRFAPTNGDGVTLFFDGYPDDDVSVSVFNRFVDTLRTRLREAGAGDTINVMMRNTVLGKGIYGYANLYNLITAAKAGGSVNFLRMGHPDPGRQLHFLVLLEEEISDSERRLDLRIENVLHGEQRVTVLRQLVPVITFDNDNWLQLQDDLIYFKDSFGGVGFWPMAVTSPPAAGTKTTPAGKLLPTTAGVQQCDVTRDISECITDFFQFVPGAQASPVCQIVCENRYAFRLVTKLVMILLICCAALYYWSCLWRKTMASYRHAPVLILTVVWLVLAMALLFCDPFLYWLSHGYMIPIFLVLFIIGLIVWYQYLLKQKDEEP